MGFFDWVLSNRYLRTAGLVFLAILGIVAWDAVRTRRIKKTARQEVVNDLRVQENEVRREISEQTEQRNHIIRNMPDDELREWASDHPAAGRPVRSPD